MEHIYSGMCPKCLPLSLCKAQIGTTELIYPNLIMTGFLPFYLFYQTKRMTSTKQITGTHLNHLDINTNKNSKRKHEITITETKIFCICLFQQFPFCSESKGEQHTYEVPLNINPSLMASYPAENRIFLLQL